MDGKGFGRPVMLERSGLRDPLCFFAACDDEPWQTDFDQYILPSQQTVWKKHNEHYMFPSKSKDRLASEETISWLYKSWKLCSLPSLRYHFNASAWLAPQSTITTTTTTTTKEEEEKYLVVGFHNYTICKIPLLLLPPLLLRLTR